ncbi:MAG: DUF1256 domain-containing protein [Natronincolaceae bacterium]
MTNWVRPLLSPVPFCHFCHPAVGDISITGIVNLSGYMEYLVLQNTRLSLVMKMADTLVQSIKYSVWRLHQKRLMM